MNFAVSMAICVRDSNSETEAPENLVPPPKWQILIDNPISRFSRYKKCEHDISPFAR